ncbi:hypothetical protein QEN19_003241 [Hanseniaspora menglaensis]
MRIFTTYAIFGVLGLVNNALYVIILSLAMDLTPPNTSKSLILLLNIFPSLFLKLTAPFLLHGNFMHNKRVFVLIVVNSVAMWLIAFEKVYLGIIFASLMSGLGELTFLQIATKIDSTVAINGWSMGTGLAGICGSLFVLLLTSVLRFSVKFCLIVSSLIPLGFLLFWTLPKTSYQIIEVEPQTFDHEEQDSEFDKIKIIKQLLYPFMLPLMVVYFAEYLINQGITPVLLFPFSKDSLLFHKFRDQYVLYGTSYQLGVLISRSSGNFIRIKKVWILSLLQLVNLLLFLIEAMYFPINFVFIVIVFSFYEGLLGGSSYVNVFLNVNDLYQSNHSLREFCIGVVTISDSLGILGAAFLGLILEPHLCQYQSSHGREYCKAL